jgi:hypothetical protein
MSTVGELAAQEFVESDTGLRQRLVAAYLVGYRLPLGMFGPGGCFRQRSAPHSPGIIRHYNWSGRTRAGTRPHPRRDSPTSAPGLAHTAPGLAHIRARTRSHPRRDSPTTAAADKVGRWIRSAAAHRERERQRGSNAQPKCAWLYIPGSPFGLRL